MLALDFLQWWYSRGWAHFAGSLVAKLRNMTDFFSFSLLIRTLFAPFRQISAQGTDSSDLATRISAFFDKLLSRCIGAVVRISIMLFGGIAIIFESALSLILVIVWPLIPFTPVACLVLCLAGVSL